MPIRVHKGDLPDLARYTGSVAIDTETLGLDTRRDRLCVVQLSPGDGSVLRPAGQDSRRARTAAIRVRNSLSSMTLRSSNVCARATSWFSG